MAEEDELRRVIDTFTNQGNQETLWDNVVLDLERQGGMAVVQVPELQDVHKNGFDRVRQALQTPVPRQDWISPQADSAHVTGYHGPDGRTSRYNAYREGFVFSDGNLVDLPDNHDFRSALELLFQSMHETIAQQVLSAMERRWKLPPGWFQSTLGPTENHSQWHVKRFVPPPPEEDEVGNGKDEEKRDEDKIWLPIHTDPSLISIVLHDSPGSQPGAMGLQYQAPSADANKKREWVEIPQHGHCVATVLVGSVLSYMTGNSLISSAKHRVVYSTQANNRIAATLFVRPKPTAMLQVPPSPLLADVKLKKPTDFHTWNTRVARNYQKQAKKKNNRKKDNCEEEKRQSDARYYRDEYTELSLLPCDPPFTGREKCLGGELGSNGKIYTIPGHATRVLVIDPTVEPPTVYPITSIGPLEGEFKWLRGVRMAKGIIYGIPCHADSVLRIDPATDTVSTLEWDKDDPKAPPKGMPWKWHGGMVSTHDKCLYCVPQFAHYVLKIDPFTEELSFVGDTPLEGTNKWYGGLVSPKDGAIYGICQNATGVLKIDAKTQSTSVHGSFPEGGYKWHGGVVAPDGSIYCVPAHADTVLKVEPCGNGEDPLISTIGGPLRTGQHRKDGKYKYLGGTVGLDGNVYFFPSDADYVLQVNPKTQMVREVGPNLSELEPIHHNKWQNGFTAPDGCMYGIPLKATSVLRIRPHPKEEPEVTTIGGPYHGLNSWEGGVMSESGDMFCMPLNHSMVLRIRPVSRASSKASDETA